MITRNLRVLVFRICSFSITGSNRTSSAFGFRDFMSQAKFKDPENGYLVDDACIIEAEFEVLGLVTVE